MSASSDEEYLDPNNPMSYAPRWMREEAKARAAVSNDDDVPELPRRNLPSTSSASSFDDLLKEAMSRSRRHPLDPELVNAPVGTSLWRELIPLAGRFAAAIGVSAVVALFFVFLVPSREHAQDTPAPETRAQDTRVQDNSTAGLLESMKAALPKAAAREDNAKPAAAGPSTVGAAQGGQTTMTREQSDALLDQFVRWQQKQEPGDTRSQ